MAWCLFNATNLSRETLADIINNRRQIQEPNATNDKFYLC